MFRLLKINIWTFILEFFFILYLVAEDPDGAGAGDLVAGEPGGGQLRRDAQDEDLADGHHRLARE